MKTVVNLIQTICFHVLLQKFYNSLSVFTLTKMRCSFLLISLRRVIKRTVFKFACLSKRNNPFTIITIQARMVQSNILTFSVFFSGLNDLEFIFSKKRKKEKIIYYSLICWEHITFIYVSIIYKYIITSNINNSYSAYHCLQILNGWLAR